MVGGGAPASRLSGLSVPDIMDKNEAAVRSIV